MIKQELLQKLLPITDEEKKIMSGNGSINRNLYMDTPREIISSKKLLSAGKIIAIRPHTRFVHFPEHSHDYVEIIYMCQGTTTHIIDGTPITLGEGELLFLCQSAKQEILPAGEDDIAINLIVLPQFFDSALTMMGEEETPLKSFIINCIKNKSGAGYLHFKVTEVVPIQNLIENLIWTLMNDTQNKRNINQMTMGLLFLHLTNHTDKLASGAGGEEIVVKALKYIEENYKNANLGDLAAKLHYDISALSREIKKKTGKKYTQLLLEKRLSQAAFLLKSTNMNITEISASVGYENASFFYRNFKEYFGVSPRDYRQASKKPQAHIIQSKFNAKDIEK